MAIGTITIDASGAAGIDLEAFIPAASSRTRPAAAFRSFDNSGAFSGEEMFIGYGVGPGIEVRAGPRQPRILSSPRIPIAGTINTIRVRYARHRQLRRQRLFRRRRCRADHHRSQLQQSHAVQPDGGGGDRVERRGAQLCHRAHVGGRRRSGAACPLCRPARSVRAELHRLRARGRVCGDAVRRHRSRATGAATRLPAVVATM